MSLLFFDGFEGGAQVPKPEWRGIPGISTSSRTGSFCGNASPVLVITPSAKVTVGFAFFTAGNNFFGGSFGALAFATDNGATTHLTITFDVNGFVLLRRGTGTGPIIATATVALPRSEWRHIQAQATIADTGGRCIVKLDGVTIIDYTGDTRNGGTSTSIDVINFPGNGVSQSWDDLWVCDGTDGTATQGRPNNDFLGDLKVQALLPDANGAQNQWTPSGAGTNAQQVDETPPNTTDYVSTATPGNRDLYSLTDLPSNTAQVIALRVGIYAQKSDAGSAGIKTLIRDPSGSIETGPTQPLSTTWSGYSGLIRCVKPSNGAVYSPADVNAVQAGVEATS